ncbi:Uncharacterised protein [Tatumella ptyseos]|nr:Uncharacterised protein [Tatumella ptyseos]
MIARYTAPERLPLTRTDKCLMTLLLLSALGTGIMQLLA